MKYDITIIISNYESLSWLRLVVHQIRKHTKIPYHIIVSEQSKDPFPVQAEYNGWETVTVLPIPAHSSGFGTDYILKYIPIESEYICSMDVDTFPISDDWLSLPIQLLNEFNLTWVGLRAEIEEAYKLHYFHMGECYRIGRTQDFKLLSDSVGFAQIRTPDEWKDNAVKAHSWEDANFKHNKFSFPVTARMGLTMSEGEYGRLIGNLVVHFCFAYTSTLHKRPEKNMGDDYLEWGEKIKTLPPDELVSQVMSAMKYSTRLQPMQYWDGTNRTSPPGALQARVKKAIGFSGQLPISLSEINGRKEIKGIIHVGANEGMEYLEYIESGIENIMMFEAENSYFTRLVELAPDNVKAYRAYLGSVDKVITEEKPWGGQLTPQYRLDDIGFRRHDYNFLYLGAHVIKYPLLAGAVETLKYIDIIYSVGTDLDEDLRKEFERVKIVTFNQINHYLYLRK